MITAMMLTPACLPAAAAAAAASLLLTLACCAASKRTHASGSKPRRRCSPSVLFAQGENDPLAMFRCGEVVADGGGGAFTCGRQIEPAASTTINAPPIPNELRRSRFDERPAAVVLLLLLAHLVQQQLGGGGADAERGRGPPHSVRVVAAIVSAHAGECGLAKAAGRVGSVVDADSGSCCQCPLLASTKPAAADSKPARVAITLSGRHPGTSQPSLLMRLGCTRDGSGLDRVRGTGAPHIAAHLDSGSCGLHGDCQRLA
ncbi:unnamed protein product [Lampetra planeri]